MSQTEVTMWYLSYWFLPLFASLVWLAMLLGMLLTWVVDGKPHLEAMGANQTVPYISDIGATSWGKPLFIAMGTITVVIFDLGFIAERWLRHTGRLTHNTSNFQKFLSVVSILAAIVGAVGLICLTIFDTLNHHTLHDTFLVVFIAGYVVSAIFICWEYQRLGVAHRQVRILAYSFWIKLAFIIVEVALAIGFGVTEYRRSYNTSGILEWIVALVYFFYVLSFFIDFVPAVHTKHHQSRETSEMAMVNDAESGHHFASDNATPRYGPNVPVAHHGAPMNGYANGYANGANGYANGTNGYANAPTNGYYANGTNGNGAGKQYAPPVGNAY